MQKRTIWISSAAVGAALVLGGTAIAFAGTDGFTGHDDSPGSSDDAAHLTGPDLEAASAAALAAAGPGTVVEAEVGDDGTSAYEVEVRLDSGETVEVELDANFAVLQIEGDDDGTGEPEETEDSDD
ncbi:PepSY domain-containing protein [Agromyces sp. NPDC058484]|uniref:PepSY domain-containing protein n=1 Tax=Agromyces sp. NPDC058484 TaxID=3346524 RepID=UPI00364619C3